MTALTDQDAFEGQLRTKLHAHAQTVSKAQQASPANLQHLKSRLCPISKMTNGSLPTQRTACQTYRRITLSKTYLRRNVTDDGRVTLTPTEQSGHRAWEQRKTGIPIPIGSIAHRAIRCCHSSGWRVATRATDDTN